MNMLLLFFVTIILSQWLYQQVKLFFKRFFQYGHFSCSKTWTQAPDSKICGCDKTIFKDAVGCEISQDKKENTNGCSTQDV